MVNHFPAELRWLFRQTRPYLRWHIGSFTVITIGSVLALVDPLVLKWLIDDILPSRDVRSLVLAVGLIFLSYEGRILLTSLGGYLTFHASQKMVLDIRMRLLNHLSSLSADYQERTPVGARLYLLKEPIEEISLLGADLFPAALRTLLLTIFIVTTMLILNLQLAFAVLPLIPAFLFIRHRFRRRLEQTADAVQNEQSKVSGFLEEHLASIVQIQLLRQERRQSRHAFGFLAEAVRARYRLWRTAIQFTVLSGSITVLGVTAVVGYGGQQVLAGALTIGGLVAFYTYLVRLFEPLSGAVELYSRLQRVGASVRKLRDAFATRPTVRESPTAMDLPKQVQGAIQFRNVSFGYRPGEELLHVPDLYIQAGERVALVGANGAGKSTLAKLIVRLCDPQCGSILIDGRDIREIRLKSLRSAVSYIPQHALLFDRSLRDNLRFGNPWASDQELLEVVELAELESVIVKLPSGWQEPLGPAGMRLSGGERQRVAIARAALQRPRILVLDEATSSLDGPAEQLILRKLDQFFPRSTLVFISHRFSTVSWATRIVVLHDGRVVTQGSHSDLYQQGGLYKQLFDERAALERATESASHD